MIDPDDPLGDGEHTAFKIKRLKEELGPKMELPLHCDYCHEVFPRHNPLCLAPRAHPRSA